MYAQAELTIEITKGVDSALPIAVVPFGAVGVSPPVDVAEVVAADLKRSGRFAPMARNDMLSRPADAVQVNIRDWRLGNVDSLVIGKVSALGAGYVVQFQLFDVFRGVQLAGYSVRSDANGLRRAAHQIADIIYETLNGAPAWAPNGRELALTLSKDGNPEIYVLELPGKRLRRITDNLAIDTEPVWSPDGQTIYFTSDRGGSPQIYRAAAAGGRGAVDL